MQRIPGYGKKVEPIIEDQLVTDVWPRFAAPYPLAEPGTNRGAGKYFLACVKQHEWSTWDLCLVDVFDNITPILTRRLHDAHPAAASAPAAGRPVASRSGTARTRPSTWPTSTRARA